MGTHVGSIAAIGRCKDRGEAAGAIETWAALVVDQARRIATTIKGRAASFQRMREQDGIAVVRQWVELGIQRRCASATKQVAGARKCRTGRVTNQAEVGHDGNG